MLLLTTGFVAVVAGRIETMGSPEVGALIDGWLCWGIAVAAFLAAGLLASGDRR